MRRMAALVWLGVVIAAGVYLTLWFRHGLPLRTDLMALLPRESQDAQVQRATDAVTGALARRVVVLVGHASRAEAREAGRQLASGLIATGLLEPETGAPGAAQIKELGRLYFPHRGGLLAGPDRALLEAGQGEEIAKRALAQAHGIGGMIDANLLRSDPFLLLPSFLAKLPFPMSRVGLDEGLLTVTDAGKTWVLFLGALRGEPFALDVQHRLTAAFDASAGALRAAYPGLEIERTGAVFFAAAGAKSAIGEASTLSTLALAGAILLILAVFRRIGPLLHNVLAVLIGIGGGLAAGLALFGDLHVVALLFGASLIGVAVDYGLHYSATVFDPKAGSPADRLRRVLPALTLGLLTTLIGYAALALSPFYGLRQIAVFSAAGLIAAFLTVVLWLPLLDRGQPARHGGDLLGALGRLFEFWDAPRWRSHRLLVLCAAAIIAITGLARLSVNDDIRRMQALAPELVQEQDAILRLTGATTASDFLLIEAASNEMALRRGEALAPILAELKAKGALAAAQSPAGFVPSAARQRDNRALIGRALDAPHLPRQASALGLEQAAPAEISAPHLTLETALASGAIPGLRDLVLGPGLHAVTLQGLARPDLVRAAFQDMPGVKFIEPTREFSLLLGKYRHRALVLAALSIALMLILFFPRYGWAGAAWVLLPPLTAIVLTPAILSLLGQEFNFFHAMALVLILAIGVDYAVFCAESGKSGASSSATMLGVLLAMLTTLLSFGLLTMSRVPAIYSFGAAMFIGISLAFFLAPLASRGRRSAASAGAPLAFMRLRARRLS